MKKKLFAILLLLLLALALVAFLKFSGVTHEDIYSAVKDESGTIQTVVDDRYRKLDAKLDRIENKLDQLLELARPVASDVLPVSGSAALPVAEPKSSFKSK